MGIALALRFAEWGVIEGIIVIHFFIIAFVATGLHQ